MPTTIPRRLTRAPRRPLVLYLFGTDLTLVESWSINEGERSGLAIVGDYIQGFGRIFYDGESGWANTPVLDGGIPEELRPSTELGVHSIGMFRNTPVPVEISEAGAMSIITDDPLDPNVGGQLRLSPCSWVRL